ncbi:MAG TPA: GAF domain-containing protein [Burkholderiaceae bacterium]
MTIRLETIRECFEGVIPATMATCSVDGVPNISYLSQIQYVDDGHLALTYQFFNKTRQNILANPYARLMVISPVTGGQYRLTVRYMHTETAGPLFEKMKAKLAGIASQVGMESVFRLLGADLYQVIDIECTEQFVMRPPSERNLMAALRACSASLAQCHDLDTLLNTALDGLDRHFGFRHAMVLMYDAQQERLYTVASHGYPESGVGSEIPLGQGVIGVAARERTLIRIGHMNAEYAYSRTIRDNLAPPGASTEIPFPGLANSRSQMAVPLVVCGALLGVLYVESERDLHFGYDEEEALQTLNAQMALQIRLAQALEAQEDNTADEAGAMQPEGTPLQVRYFEENGSVFFDDDYLIKGVAGTILWTLLQDYVQSGRTAFTNRELRLDARIRLPDLADNLEARLILLARRLAERSGRVLLVKAGRGRFTLQVGCPLKLSSATR